MNLKAELKEEILSIIQNYDNKIQMTILIEAINVVIKKRLFDKSFWR